MLAFDKRESQIQMVRTAERNVDHDHPPSLIRLQIFYKCKTNRNESIVPAFPQIVVVTDDVVVSRA